MVSTTNKTHIKPTWTSGGLTEPLQPVLALVTEVHQPGSVGPCSVLGVQVTLQRGACPK